MLFSVKCMELEDTMLSDISQTEKDKKHMFFLMQGDKKKCCYLLTEAGLGILRKGEGKQMEIGEKKLKK